jgi:hypothetical protein
LREILADPGAPRCRQTAGRVLGGMGAQGGWGGRSKGLHPYVPPRRLTLRSEACLHHYIGGYLEIRLLNLDVRQIAGLYCSRDTQLTL